ncbi:MAG TPA: hypothetical protein VHO05_08035 [Hyphomicrobium sp.]|nr:hypothetical protein [Hyphomicrobium sp.]
MQPLLRLAAAGPLGLRMIVRPLLASAGGTSSRDDHPADTNETNRDAFSRERFANGNELDRLEL